MLELLNEIDSFVWGPPLMVLLIGTGILLTVRLGIIGWYRYLVDPAFEFIAGA
jgi:AGCS family alanine or glycine:cation symporter